MKKQGVKLGDGKVSKTGNELDKLKDLNNHNSNFKGRYNPQRRSLNSKKTTIKEMITMNVNILVNNLEGNRQRISLRKICY